MCILCYELYHVPSMGHKENNSKHTLKTPRLKLSDPLMKFTDMKLYIIMKIFLVHLITTVFCYTGNHIT